MEPSTPAKATTLEEPVNSFLGDVPQQDGLHFRLVGPPPADLESEDAKKQRMKEWTERRERMLWKAQVDYLDYDRFKNRYAPDDGLAIIEVLLGYQGLSQDIWKEINQRRMEHWGMRAPRGSSKTREDDDTWIQRVRIQSPHLLLLLSRLTGHGDKWANLGPRVFYRPFLALHYYLPQMKECLEILESRWSIIDQRGAPDMPLPSAAVPKSTKTSEGGSDPESETFRPMAPVESVVGPVVDSVTTLRQVRKYIEFVETEISPLWKRAAGTTHRKVSFVDLWMTFQPGELVYIPSASESPTGQIWPEPAGLAQKVWRLHTITRDTYPSGAQCDIPMNSRQELDLWCYFIDFNGVSYEPYPRRFSIRAYQGQKDITTLQVYPLRFLKERETLLDSQQKVGLSFQAALAERYLYYEGWTLAYEPTTAQPTTGGGSEHVDGPVMIDFVEAHKSDDELATKSSHTLGGWQEAVWDDREDEYMIKHWDSQGGLLQGEVTEILQISEDFIAKFSDRDYETNKFLREFKSGSVKELGTDDLILLPRRVVGYTFHERRFVRFDVQSLRPISKAENVFEDLKIDKEHKGMVRALVKAHFQNEKLNLDLIRGKGSGLVILLHGVPGVGKTATAEAVAQANQKPLFAITCGDLGFDPSTVESKLKEIFRLAHLWDCVLLLDEADIFLTRRDLSNLNQNALVSVFLRVLEYYSGVLFLTTNRVGILDEAFKSRIHLSLYYKHLDLDQTLAIFKNNIRRLQKVGNTRNQYAKHKGVSPGPTITINEKSILHYAQWHFERNPDHRWNGRQIRNAFQTAYSLAHFDVQSAKPDQWNENTEENDRPSDEPHDEVDLNIPPSREGEYVLDYRQFKLISQTIQRFDNYLLETTGETEAEQALNMTIRADDYDPADYDDGPVYNPNPPRQRQRPGSYYPPRGSGRGRAQSRGGRARPVYRQNTQRQPAPLPEYDPPSQEYLDSQQEARAIPRTVPQPGKGPLSSTHASAGPGYRGRGGPAARRAAGPRASGLGRNMFPPERDPPGHEEYLAEDDVGEEYEDEYYDPEDETYDYGDGY
ncbi:hypothetical protein BO94DRAFT_494050 [Aspergillus sclerotioniger CBS 115572]|uniref:AAA+ ATPase domain-containing protein n=1 Tax=Aspergillus sclerotioniger CBS 115572 TaxID=1450535 RepID=A0A317WLF5_9EURO|nr:hypothetical protein BO94DRAFT_494050 [Aspergillus sclerotioniger CBS 115572]PWY85887.1 hypothetical protein BO94DRAFT_494050 [Aspergillus sclerotioniger CBS 115572]